MKKKAKSRSSKKKKSAKSFSHTLKAFQLVGFLVIGSMVISLAIIHLVKLRSSDSTITEENTTEDYIPETTERNETATAVDPDEPIAITENTQLPAAEPQTPAAVITPPSSRQAPARQVPDRTTQNPRIEDQRIENQRIENPRTHQGNLVFIIDDAGNNLIELEPFLRIPAPLTIAVLPGLPHSAEASRRIRNAGKEVILHQPMEAIGGQNPGPGAIYSGMSRDEVREILRRNIAEVGPVAGLNNHQGSKITTDSEIMRYILEFCADHNLFFVDSRTTAESVVPFLARQMGIKIGERNFFIDNEQSRRSMDIILESALERARKEGISVLIGHTWSPELASLLTEQLPLLERQGFRIKTASQIIE